MEKEKTESQENEGYNDLYRQIRELTYSLAKAVVRADKYEELYNDLRKRKDK